MFKGCVGSCYDALEQGTELEEVRTTTFVGLMSYCC